MTQTSEMLFIAELQLQIEMFRSARFSFKILRFIDRQFRHLIRAEWTSKRFEAKTKRTLLVDDGRRNSRSSQRPSASEIM